MKSTKRLKKWTLCLLPAFLSAAGCGPSIRVGAPPNAERLGRIVLDRSLLESEQECVERLQGQAAALDATHIDDVAHTEAYFSGVSYHFPETGRPATCSASVYRARVDPDGDVAGRKTGKGSP